ncbi:MAG TPA: cupin domain-containing protein [Dehalococcoidia bacterium]|nr:cupin domain-containing protein [Dehalococcoidia bacterium]
MTAEAQSPKTTYQRWIEQEGLPIIGGYGVEDVTQVPRRPWARTGGLGAFIQLEGMQGVTAMYVAEIPPGAALNPEKHLYEEVIYVLKGRGLTEVWQEGQGKRVFEWQEGSLFAPPLNAWHRLVNGGREPVLLLVETNAPMVMDLYHNIDFIFNCDYLFKDRYEGQEGFFTEGDKRYRAGLTNVWETNFIPDVRTALLDPQEIKASGGRSTTFEMGGNVLVGHIGQWPVGRYHKAHHHGAGAVLLILRSKGYVLMWPNEFGIHPYQAGREDAVVKFDWGPGSIYSPPHGWFHQHLNLGPEPARQLALRYGSHRNPMGFHVAAHRRKEGHHITVREGGTLIEYEDEDPEVRRRYEEALRREGIDCEMPTVVYR